MNRNRQQPRRWAFLLLTLSLQEPRASLNIDTTQSSGKAIKGLIGACIKVLVTIFIRWDSLHGQFARNTCGSGRSRAYADLTYVFLNDDLSRRTLPFNRAITDQPQHVLVAKNYRLQITRCWCHSSTRRNKKRERRYSYYIVIYFVDVYIEKIKCRTVLTRFLKIKIWI